MAAPTVIEERSGATFATASPRPRPPTTRRELPSWVAPLIGVVVMVGGWWVVALVWDNPSSLPTPSAVFDFMQENWRNLWDNAWATAQTAKWGWIIGNSIAVFFALIAAIAPVAERFVVRVAVMLPLYLAGEVAWLGVSKIALGWPAYLVAVLVMGMMLAAGHTAQTPDGDAEERDRDRRRAHVEHELEDGNPS